MYGCRQHRVARFHERGIGVFWASILARSCSTRGASISICQPNRIETDMTIAMIRLRWSIISAGPFRAPGHILRSPMGDNVKTAATRTVRRARRRAFLPPRWRRLSK